VDKFSEFVKMVRTEVDGLIALMGVKEQVDRGMKTDIRTLGWHPDLSRVAIRHDWEKLQLIREACVVEYPEYIEVTETALKYINEELREAGLAHLRAAIPARPKTPEGKAGLQVVEKQTDGVTVQEKGDGKRKEKRPGLLSKLRSWTKSSSRVPQTAHGRSGQSTTPTDLERQRSLSEDLSLMPSHQQDLAHSPRSQSMSAVPDLQVPLDLDTKLESVPTLTLEEIEKEKGGQQHIVVEHSDPIPIPVPEEQKTGLDLDPLMQADTHYSLIERHDMFKGVGRIETKDVRDKAHHAEAGGYR
jgi:hypothetical protein